MPALFRRRSFVAGVILSLSFFSVIFGFFFIFTIYLQIGLGYSILKAGLTGIPFSLGVSLAAGMSGPVLVPRFGRKIISAGPLIMGAGYALFLWTIRHYGGDVTPWEFIPSLFIAGLGMGCVVAPIYPFILAEVPIKDAGSASGVVNTMQQIGGAIGVAVIGVIFFGLIGDQAQVSVESVRDELTADLSRDRRAGFAASEGDDELRDLLHRSRQRARTSPPCRRAASVARRRSRKQRGVRPAIDRGDPRRRSRRAAWRPTSATSPARWSARCSSRSAALIVIFFLSFLLPRAPAHARGDGKLAAEGVVGV